MTRFEKMEGYPDEIQGRFNSFITTQFDDSLSVEMQIRSIIKWAIDNFEEMDQTYNDFTEYVIQGNLNPFIQFLNGLIEHMNEFVDTFDTKLQTEILDSLQEWYADGTLETLINESLDTKYHEMDNRLTAQLAQKVGGGNKAELEDLSSTVLSAIEGGEGTSFNLLSIPQDRSVTQEKTTLKASFGDIDETTGYLTGKQFINSYMTQSDLTFPRGSFSVVDGDLKVTQAPPAFNYALFPDDITEIEYTQQLAGYFILGQENDVTYMLGIGSSTNGRIYEVTDDVTTLGRLLTTLSFDVPSNGELIRAERKSNAIVFKKNGESWFEVSEKNHPSLVLNKLGLTVNGTTLVDRVIAGKLKKISRRVSDVSGIEKIETLYHSPVPETDTGYNDLNVAFIGDSITVNNGPLYYPNYITSLSEKYNFNSVQNLGVSGSAIGVRESHPMSDRAMVIEYEKINEGTDLVFVRGGTNDYRGAGADGVPIGTKGSSDINTFYGALRVLIEGIINKVPTKDILFITPTRRKNDHQVNSEGHTLIEYVDAIIEMCEDYSIPCLDLYRNGNVNKININEMTTDGLHLNPVSNISTAHKISKFMEENVQ